MASKIFKTLDEQIELLKNKNLIIEDETQAKEILLRENYFFLGAYRYIFLKDDGSKKFINGVTFDEVYSLFKFDRKLRNIFFKNILIVENNYKSIFSYVLSKSYGYREKDYLSPTNFDYNEKTARQINDLIRKMKRQIRINGGQNRATSHYINNYGYIPLWVGVKVISLGIVSELFGVLKYEDQKNIANFYGVTENNLELYLPILANYRNLCAHEDILFGFNSNYKIPDLPYHKELNIPKFEDEYIYGKNDLFSFILILKEMLTKDDFKMLINEINYELDCLFGVIKSIDSVKILDRLGFPKNYNEIMYI